MSRHHPTTLGLPSLLPKRELLTSQRGANGLWHAHYPTATATLCVQDVQPFQPVEAWPPTCPTCKTIAAAWDSVDGCIPDHWRAYDVVPPTIKDAA